MPTLKTILLVEDEPDIRAVAKLALEAIGGFTVQVAESGHDALRLAPTIRPDMILLDVMMPGLDGLATFAALRQISEVAETPVVFMTAKVQRHEVEQYTSLGALDVITKPFDPMTLASMITGIWNQHYELAA